MPMRISGIETISIKHPWGPPEEGATRDWLTVRVHTEGGLTGIGRGGDAGLIHDESAPLLEGREPQRIAALAEAHDVYVAPHGAQFPEINAHLVAAVPNGLMVSTCPDSEPYHIWSQDVQPQVRGGGTARST